VRILGSLAVFWKKALKILVREGRILNDSLVHDSIIFIFIVES
jgi:hypothetical protein